jgi:putative transposase
MLLVYRYRIKSLTGLLNSQARACNFVWNFCNDTQLQALKWNKRWPSGFDLNRLTALLGLGPLKGRDLKREGQAFRFAGNTFRVFHSRPLPEGKIKDGTNFSCDARGHWFLNIVVEVAAPEPRPVRRGIGIDLGIKDFAASRLGRRSRTRGFCGSWLRNSLSQRARKRRQTTNIYARIANARRDFHHKRSTRIVREFDRDINSAQNILFRSGLSNAC